MEPKIGTDRIGCWRHFITIECCAIEKNGCGLVRFIRYLHRLSRNQPVGHHFFARSLDTHHNRYSRVSLLHNNRDACDIGGGVYVVIVRNEIVIQ